MGEEKTILIVEDAEESIDLLVELLSEYKLLAALDGESALKIAREEKIDLILLDIMMPSMDGLKTCEKLKLDKRTQPIPIIFITAKTDEESIERAFDVGGLDYITKPFKPRELMARVKTQLKLHSLIDHLKYISSYDQMTGIYNRRKFFELGEKMYAESKNRLFAVMMDIDKFKAINDAYGHPTGDKVIKAVARVIMFELDENAVPGRVGGEEFAILLPFGSKEPVYDTVESIRLAVEELEFTSDNKESFNVTISAGIAAAQVHHNSLDDLLKEADGHLYEAKGEGRNRSIFRD